MCAQILIKKTTRKDDNTFWSSVVISKKWLPSYYVFRLGHLKTGKSKINTNLLCECITGFQDNMVIFKVLYIIEIWKSNPKQPTYSYNITNI